MKILKAAFPKRCTGCELCVFEIQRQLKKIGLEDSFIRVLRTEKQDSGIEFMIEIDPRTNELDIEAVKEICPAQVFEIVEGELHEFEV